MSGVLPYSNPGVIQPTTPVILNNGDDADVDQLLANDQYLLGMIGAQDQVLLDNYIPVGQLAAIQAGTSTQDISAYLQTAVSAQAALGGGYVRVGPGDWPYAASVTVPVGVGVLGAGRGATRFRALPNSNVDYFLATPNARSYLGTGYNNGATLNAYRDFTIDCNGSAQTVRSGGILSYGATNLFEDIAIINHLNICALRTEYPLGFTPAPFDDLTNTYVNVVISQGVLASQAPTDPNAISMYLNGPSDSRVFGGGVSFCTGFAYTKYGPNNTGTCVFGKHDAGQTYYGTPAAQWSSVVEGGGTMFNGCVFEGGLYGQILARAACTVDGGQIYSQGIGIQIGDTANGFINVGVIVGGKVQVTGMLFSVVFDSDGGSDLDILGFSNCVQIGAETGKTQAGYLLFNNTGTYTPVAGDIVGKPYTGTMSTGTIGRIQMVGTCASHGPTFYRPTLYINRAYASNAAAAAAGIQLGEEYLNTSTSQPAVTIRTS